MTGQAMDGYIWMGDLSERHQRALRIIVAKYRRGAAEHGDLKRGKDWTKDIIEEGIDDAMYRVHQLMEIQDHLNEMYGDYHPECAATAHDSGR